MGIKQIADRIFGITDEDSLSDSLSGDDFGDFNKDVEDAIRKIDEYNAQHNQNSAQKKCVGTEWIKKKIMESKNGEVLIKTQDLMGELFPEFLVENGTTRSGIDILVFRLKTEYDPYINKLEKVKNPIVGTCPRCGNNLVLRINSKNGNEFAGCSSFPRCKYTKGFP